MQYDRFASELAAVYALFTAALAGQFLSTKQRTLTTSTILQLQVDGGVSMNVFLRASEALVGTYVSQVTGGAPADTATTERATLFMRALRAIAFDNVVATVQTAKRGQGVKDLLSRPAGSLAELLKRRTDSVPSLKSKDLAGRAWQSDVLVKFLARDFAYQTFLANQLIILAKQGDLVEVAYLNPAHENNGLVLSISGAPGYPSVADARDNIFHPNASAQLIHHVSA